MSRSARAWIALLIATLVFVPPLVRASQTLDRTPSSSALSIRLNRGFDAPETKCRVAPPPTAAVSFVVCEASVPPLDVVGSHRGDIALPVGQYDSPPDALRGPPSSIA